MQKQVIRRAFVHRHSADSLSRITHIELAFDSAHSPRFPSFLLTIEQAQKLASDLAKTLGSVNA